MDFVGKGESPIELCVFNQPPGDENVPTQLLLVPATDFYALLIFFSFKLATKWRVTGIASAE